VSDTPNRVAIISNPSSGHNRDQFERIGAMLDACPRAIHRITGGTADIPAVLAELATQRPSLLVINGGDGTASAILGEMLESNVFEQLPLIALLPGGTANMNAGDIGVKGNLLKATQRLCQWLDGEQDQRGIVQHRRLLRICNTSTGAVHHGMFVGAGAILQGTEYAHQEIHARGLRDDFSLALGVLRTVWGVVRDDPRFNQHVTIELALDGAQPSRHDTLILAISTLERLAFGMQPFWGERSGAVRITLMEQHCQRFLRTFISIIRGRPNRFAIPACGYQSHAVSRARIVLNGSLNIDGEIIDTDGEVLITATPELGFLSP
jgi:diacylglycerol kinase (ATP)